MNSVEIELAVAKYFDYRRNLIVPNVFWGLGFLYELDLLVLTPSNIAYEVEIKTSLSDLKADKKKRSVAHNSNRITRFYFAIPESLIEKSLNHIPEKAGVFSVSNKHYAKLIRPPKINKLAKKFTPQERIKLAELAAMRIWTLKENLYNYKKNHAKQ